MAPGGTAVQVSSYRPGGESRILPGPTLQECRCLSVKVRANRANAQIARTPSVPSLHWGNGKEGNGSALGMSEVAHLPAHPG